MRSARHMNEEMLIERHAEHGLLRFVNGANRTHIAKINNFPMRCTVYDRSGNPIELDISKVNEKAWKKYCDHRSSPLELGILTDNFIPVVKDVSRWLRSGGYSERYAYAKSATARKFILYASLLLTAYYFAQFKYQDHAFVDKWVECEVGKILTAQQYTEEIHKATAHAKKHDEDLAAAQEAVYLKYLSLLENRKFVAYEALPALPTGIVDPLILPDEEDEDGE